MRCGGASETFEADSLEEAREQAADWAGDGDYEEITSTFWVDWRLDQRVGEEWEPVAGGTVEFEPDEPICLSRDEDHDWQSPLEVVGGIRENPGVWGHGGGAVICECCMKCGAQRRTDTWAQRSDTGEQGLTSVSYEPAGYYTPPEELIDG